MLPYMHMQLLKYMSFQEYRDRSTGKDLDLRDVDVIVDEIKRLHGLE